MSRRQSQRGLSHIGCLLSCMVLLLAVSSVRAQTNVVSRPVAVYRMDIPPESHQLLAMPLRPFDETINGVFFDQLVGAPTETQADVVRKWDMPA